DPRTSKDIMKRLLGLLTTWSEKILSVAPDHVQRQARQKAERLLRLVGGNPNLFLSDPAVQRPHDPGQGSGQNFAHKSDAVAEPFMEKARTMILSKGGVVGANVFTKIALALLDQYDWRGIPSMPVEIVLLPPRFLFSLYALSYWSRTVLTPLLIIFHYKPVCRIPKEQGIDELYLTAREWVNFRREPPFRKDHRWLTWRNFFITLDGVLRFYERVVPQGLRKKAIARAAQWMLKRMEGDGGLGAIYPAMANSVVALRCLGYEVDHPLVRKDLREIEALEVHEGNAMHLQPCFSPVWDTPLTINALIESGLPQDHPALVKAARWTLSQQCRKVGDWIVSSPTAEPGGWSFQFENEFYPDNDDTAVVVIALS